ncbi:MAG: hypothetical protein IT292_12145 [Deltaproteobacteria bacterium]|nr:hypothetical protein [Deltaproteobacteria bacterium]
MLKVKCYQCMDEGIIKDEWLTCSYCDGERIMENFRGEMVKCPLCNGVGVYFCPRLCECHEMQDALV